MKTKQLILSAFAFVFLGLSSFAQNTPNGNVFFNSWPDQQNKTITMDLRWLENTTTIQPTFYWDTVPGLYRHSMTGPNSNSFSGNATIVINNVTGCQNYYLKCEFIDKITSIRYELLSFIKTAGDKAPMIKGIQFPNMGYTFAELMLNVEPFCNNFDLEIKVNEPGKLPSIQYKENWGDINNSNNIHKFLYGLEPDRYYELTITVSSWLGTEVHKYGFQTPSNLPPVAEYIRTKYLGAQIALAEVSSDSKNTQAQLRIEYGEDLSLSDNTDWLFTYGKKKWEIYLYNLKSNTVYFSRTVIKNDFGQYEDKIRLFKTTENYADIKEITWNDLLNVSNHPRGLTVNVEKPAKIDIYNLSGSNLYSQECNKSFDISLAPGVYLIKMYIAGQVIAKKALVF